MGAVSSLTLGLMGDYVEAKENPERYGYLLTVMVCFSYLTCSLPFYIGACMYKRFIRSKELVLDLGSEFSSFLSLPGFR